MGLLFRKLNRIKVVELRFRHKRLWLLQLREGIWIFWILLLMWNLLLLLLLMWLLIAHVSLFIILFDMNLTLIWWLFLLVELLIRFRRLLMALLSECRQQWWSPFILIFFVTNPIGVTLSSLLGLIGDVVLEVGFRLNWSIVKLGYFFQDFIGNV